MEEKMILRVVATNKDYVKSNPFYGGMAHQQTSEEVYYVTKVENILIAPCGVCVRFTDADYQFDVKVNNLYLEHRDGYYKCIFHSVSLVYEICVWYDNNSVESVTIEAFEPEDYSQGLDGKQLKIDCIQSFEDYTELDVKC